mmetsp:Transcript_26173/g.40578  ORF Transcript_26173/g.40578 Transcript_26173/m.40578 type:complete len:229 (-) Transcript_26173:110-796(-)
MAGTAAAARGRCSSSSYRRRPWEPALASSPCSAAAAAGEAGDTGVLGRRSGRRPMAWPAPSSAALSTAARCASSSGTGPSARATRSSELGPPSRFTCIQASSPMPRRPCSSAAARAWSPRAGRLSSVYARSRRHARGSGTSGTRFVTTAWASILFSSVVPAKIAALMASCSGRAGGSSSSSPPPPPPPSEVPPPPPLSEVPPWPASGSRPRDCRGSAPSATPSSRKCR